LNIRVYVTFICEFQAFIIHFLHICFYNPIQPTNLYKSDCVEESYIKNNIVSKKKKKKKIVHENIISIK